MQLNNTADAAAYSAAVQQARTYNMIAYLCLFMVLYPRYPKRGARNFFVSRTATAADFENVAETEDELEQLKLRCAVLSETLWWKTLYLRISFILSMICIVATIFLLFYAWYG